MPDDVTRCAWVGDEPLMVRYHDEEWGVPLHDVRRLFECLTLEGAQAGLSWRTILLRREGYRAAFHGWDISQIARMDAGDVERILQDPGVIRHRGKIESAVHNARIVESFLPQWGSLDAYLWRFVEGVPIVGGWHTLAEVPAATEIASSMSRELRRDGFRFVGPTTIYAFMQASGMVDDHTVDCFRFARGSSGG